MSTRQQPSTDQAGRSQINEARSQERIVHFVLDDWMSIPAERESSRFSPTSFWAHTLPEVTSCTEVGTEHQQQYAGLVGPHDRVFAVRINDGGITATAVVAHLVRDDRFELLQAYCDWPSEGKKRELDAQRQLALA
ncbi:MAG TPA: hypothetical protein VF844_11865 [Ktedonobacteraceae bacterium]